MTPGAMLSRRPLWDSGTAKRRLPPRKHAILQGPHAFAVPLQGSLSLQTRGESMAPTLKRFDFLIIK